MPGFEESRIIAVPVERMFDVVLDIDAYSSYLPWVSGSRVLTRHENELTAELVAEFAGIRHPFRTRDNFLPPKLIEIRLIDGPFKFLDSVWTFDRVNDTSCRVHFSIEFEFKSMMLGLVAAPIFGAACRSMVHTFEQRALKKS